MSDISDALSKLSVQGLQETSCKTGLVYDDRMIEHSCLWDPGHIEKPERYMHSLQRCRDYNLIDKCLSIPSRFANEEELLLAHTKEYINVIKDSKLIGSITDLEGLSSTFDSVYFHPKTYDCALLAAGSCLELVSSVLQGTVDNGLAVVRPPGHHAMVNQACGFCFFNNVAIAAKHALKNFNLNRILIIDWDIHHGQATQQMFFDDPRVLYFSIHRYEHGEFWPHLRESNFDFTGEKSAQGYNINVPLNATKLGDAEYLAIFHNVLLPVAYEFNPELILISAGFDAAIGCPEGEMNLTPHIYPHFINSISSLANGRICVILEGGYCLHSLSESVALTLRALLGYPCPTVSLSTEINESAVESILNVISVQRPFWDSIKLQNLYDIYSDDTISKHVVCPKYAGNPLEGMTVFPTRETYPVQSALVASMFASEIENLILKTDLSVPKLRTCLIFDPKMTQHVNKREKNHPEKADRVLKIFEKLQNTGLLSKCLLLDSREANEAELSLVHDANHIINMKSTSTMSYRDIAKLESEYDSVYICQETYKSAVIATGSLLQTVDAVAQRICRNGFALIRPPGHHADVSNACGFCIFNSVAIAAKYLISRHSMQKILILDWDIHHGNGTQNIFYQDKNVLYISLHLHDGDFFPGSPEADYTAVGRGLGEGFNVNIPFNTVSGDGDYLAAFFHIVLPIAYEFAPDFVLVSAGFDAVLDDPLGGCFVTPPCFGIMTKLLSSLCNGKIVLALEGGYNLDQTSEAVAYCISALLGELHVDLKPMKPTLNAIKTIQNVVRVQKKYWKYLQFDVELPDVMAVSSFEENGAREIRSKSIRSSEPVAIPKREDNPGHSDMLATGCATGGVDGMGAFYCVTPLEYCPHLELLQQIPAEGLNPYASCQACNDPNENWVCLHCYQVYCGRFINQHMLQHGIDMQHFLTLSYSDLSVWCYGCDAYIHNETLVPIKEHACYKKFG